MECKWSLSGLEMEMSKMTIEEMRRIKRELGYSYEQIAELSGVPLGTVQKVLLEITKTPRHETLLALESVFEKHMKQTEVKKPMVTVADYLEIPEDVRVELIDGVLYDMAAPTALHQAVSGEIFAKFRDYIRESKGKCMTFISPIDVQLDCDDKTMVQPDVIILCDRTKLKSGRIFGAPDLVVEVLSKSTRKKDGIIKNTKYANAGVKEYWVVDPEKRRVIVYKHEDEIYVPAIYSFTDKIPVGIWENACEIDFSEIYDYISFLYEEDENV